MSTKSSLPFTSVVSYHTNEYGCGVAKFSKQLAERLGVPFVGLDGEWGVHPLLSLKFAENPPIFAHRPKFTSFSVFWHDRGYPGLNNEAEMVFYADPSLGRNGLFCPSLIQSSPRPVRLFSFGFGHKGQATHFAKVKDLLDGAGLDYRLRVSSGVHEGTSLAESTRYFDELKRTMGADKVSVLGILSDEAVIEELHRADCVLAFFEHGLRANNTTVHAAIDARVPVITNWDIDTPFPIRASTHDIHFEKRWPLGSSPAGYTWDNLIANMEAIYAKSANRQPAHQ